MDCRPPTAAACLALLYLLPGAPTEWPRLSAAYLGWLVLGAISFAITRHLARLSEATQRVAAGDLDAVTLVGRAGFDGVQEDDPVRGLLYRHAEVLQALKLFGQQG